MRQEPVIDVSVHHLPLLSTLIRSVHEPFPLAFTLSMNASNNRLPEAVSSTGRCQVKAKITAIHDV